VKYSLERMKTVRR